MPRLRSPKPDPFRVVAIVSAYNEADVISPVIRYLVEQGIDVYLIDNRSTDATVIQARPWLGKGLLEIEEFPREPPQGDGPFPFDWGAILRRKEEIAGQVAADWIIHHDADEFRESPWPGRSLKEGIRWVDRLGYNCIDFRVLNFPPVDDGFRPGDDPRDYFTRWKEPIVHDTVQLKCWKAGPAPISLAATGGHEVRFPGRRAFPVKFLLRHYPIRGQAYGRRIVFAERKNRFLESERA
jgi:glycosyltransferase involved in cell wall biosynthesis